MLLLCEAVSDDELPEEEEKEGDFELETPLPSPANSGAAIANDEERRSVKLEARNEFMMSVLTRLPVEL